MEERNVCALQLSESDASNISGIAPHVASVAGTDKVINTTIIKNVSQIEGDLEECELLKGLLTDDYCHVCEAVLLFESQRVSHYKQGLMLDKEHYCELCSMVFSSPVTAHSHYQGKVHAKNLRKQSLYPVTQSVGPELTSLGASHVSTTLNLKTEPQVPETNILEIDLKDPNKCCSICAASFNNPQMALQHYNGRKHQRNQSRQQLLKELGEDIVQDNSLMCPLCSIEFNSVEMYQAHMQGNKHQTKQKKVAEICKAQQRVYNSFEDELADYVQVQKACGLDPKTRVGLVEKEGKEEGAEEGGVNTDTVNSPNRFDNPPLPPYSTSYYNHSTGWGNPYQAKRCRKEDSEKGEILERRDEVNKAKVKVHMQSEISEEQEDKYLTKSLKPKHRKDRKKTKEIVDIRTEEEKLWDESILGLRTSS
ncbi:zinc finger matrin-type protein 1 [Aplochiton taeniatus]